MRFPRARPATRLGRCPILGYQILAAANNQGAAACTGSNITYTVVGSTSSPVDVTFSYVVASPGATYCIKVQATNFKSMYHRGKRTLLAYLYELWLSHKT